MFGLDINIEYILEMVCIVIDVELNIIVEVGFDY